MNVGILGAGQLGRMLALGGYPLGHQFGFLGESPQESAALLGRMFVKSTHTKPIQALVDFADVITFESENTDVEQLRKIKQNVAVYPSEKSLFIAQHRGREKRLFNQLNIPCASYQIVNSAEDLATAISIIGLPAILKTVTEGYDGKGQFLLREKNQIAKAWAGMQGRESILESFVDFKRELSLIAVRGLDKDIKYYPLVENIHHEGILRKTIVPAQTVSPKIQQQAQNYMLSLLNAMDYVGVLTIELFETKHGLMANEMAPRVHNSGHWSIEGANTSQFENHIRAITGMPLGDTVVKQPFCAMINLIGKLESVDTVLKMPNAYLHLYNKVSRKNRKLGHITITANTQAELDERIAVLSETLL